MTATITEKEPVTRPEDLLSQVVHAICVCITPFSDGPLTAVCGHSDNSGWTQQGVDCPICLDIMESAATCPRCGVCYRDIVWCM